MSRLHETQEQYLHDVLASDHWTGDGPFSERCCAAIREETGAKHVFLTPSATAALEMCALLADLKHGDEVIMPSFAFPSCANAVVLRGAVPVFVDVRTDTLNIDENRLEEALTKRTRAVMMLHYAGVCCNCDAISAFARQHDLLVFEDAAQAYLSSYKGRMAGTLADMAALSFHGTKNVRSGEGGAFLTDCDPVAERAAIVREKGTDRSRFMRGLTQKYTWVEIGSSYLPSEFQAAVLLAELEQAQSTTSERMALWNLYHEGFADLERRGKVQRPVIPPECEHNAHIYHIRLPGEQQRDALLDKLHRNGIATSFHFLPLHLSQAGKRYGRPIGSLDITVSASSRLLRLPLGPRTTETEVHRVVAAVETLI